MADAFLVSVRLETLRQNFTIADGRDWSADEVMEWLAECGFKPSAGLWVVEGLSLDVLDESEYRVVKRL